MSVKKIQTVAPIVNKKLVPAKEYKGVVLKLTQKDKETISRHQEKIAELEVQKYKLLNMMESKRNWNIRDQLYLNIQLDRLDTEIKYFMNLIKSIKVARHNKQLKKQNKKLDIIG